MIQPAKRTDQSWNIRAYRHATTRDIAWAKGRSTTWNQVDGVDQEETETMDSYEWHYRP